MIMGCMYDEMVLCLCLEVFKKRWQPSASKTDSLVFKTYGTQPLTKIMEMVSQTMSNIDKILDLELQKELIQLETEMLQANIDCLNALDELEEIRDDLEDNDDRDD